jgi:spore coat assembly protein SafA
MPLIEKWGGFMVNSISNNNNSSQSSSNDSGSKYTVKSGDTLSEIAQRNNVSLNSVIKANPQIKNPDLIFPGQQINMPGGGAGKTGNLGGVPVSRGNAPAERPAGMGDVPEGADAMGGVRKPPVGNTSGGVTAAQLRQIMPTLSASKAQQYLPYLNAAMNEFKINTPERKAAFLAQLAHESGDLKYMEEIASGAAYEGRRDLGNTQPGDGTRFKGRGPIQLTGRANYREAGRALGLNLEGNPRQVATPEVGFRVAGHFWQSRNLNSLADSRSFDSITKRVNGGFNGKASRDMYYNRALNALT